MANLPSNNPKARLQKKKTLREMMVYVMELRARQVMRNPHSEKAGQAADFTYIALDPEDFETLDDIAATLEYFDLQQQKKARWQS
ncbi:hypothetical protein [Microcystis phage Mae-JY30]